MSETYMITAKTVEEAIAIANREYADESHEVSYEIIDMPKKGFLGIGAKDAKIKVTVTKSVSADLDSIVADLKNMKVFTSKGDSGETKKDRQQKQNPQKQQKQQNSQPAKPAQNGQNNQKQQKPQPAQQQKSAQPAQNAQNNQNNQKQNKPQQNAQTQPKTDKPAVKKDKPAQPKAEKIEAKAEKAEAKAEKVEAKVEPKAESSEKKQNTSGTSSLRNQAKPGKRQAQKKHNPAEAEITASSTTISAPVGLTDYVAEENTASFGSSSNNNSGSGRMSNDVRRKKNNKSNNANANANAGSNADVLKPGKTYKNNSVIYEDRSSMTTRYDVAESDEDYKKLDDLEDRELTIEEIRASVKGTAVQASDDDQVSVEEEVSVKPDKLCREAVTEDEMNFALEFANTLLKNMQINASAVPAECPEGEEFDTTENAKVYPKINIIGDDTGILIGHHGETLDSIQYLVNLSAIRRSKQKDGDYVKIVVDIENYREKREETLRALARRMAARAVKYKRNVFLEPMNAYERRIIHSELQSFENVSTHSVGSDRDRKIIITYEGEDKAPDNRRRGRKGHTKAQNDAGMNESVSEKVGKAEKSEKTEEQKEHRRPRKVQKMPIEKLDEILPDAAVEPDTAASEAENE